MTREELLSRISIDPNVCFGKPCIRGHRIWVSLVLDWLASGSSEEEILDNYPGLERVHIEAELDAVHAERLVRLQGLMGKPLPEVLEAAIDASLAQAEAQARAPSKLYRAFEEAGLLGCIETHEELTTT